MDEERAREEEGENRVRNEKRRKRNSLSASLPRALSPCYAPAFTCTLSSTFPPLYRTPFFPRPSLLDLLETYRSQRPRNSLCWRPPRPVPSPPYTHICSCDRSCKTVPGKHRHQTIVLTRVEGESMERGLEHCQVQSAGISRVDIKRLAWKRSIQPLAGTHGTARGGEGGGGGEGEPFPRHQDESR